MKAVLKAATEHKGAAFVEVWQNCVIFNDACFKEWSDKSVRAEKTINLVPGQPMVYGADDDKGLRFEGCGFSIVPAAEASVWDPTIKSAGPAFQLSQLDNDPDMPRPFGVYRAVEAPTLEDLVHDQVKQVTDKRGVGNLKDLIYTPDCWTVD